MAKRAQYSDQFRTDAVLMLEAAGYPKQPGALTRVAKQLNLHARTLSRWFNKEQNPPPDQLVSEKRIELVDAIRNEVYAALGEMPAAREDANYKDLGTVAAILIDKLQLLDGKPTQRIETIEAWLDRLPADEYEDVIAEAQRIIRESSGGDPRGTQQATAEDGGV